MEAQANGRAFLGLIRYVKQSHGAQGDLVLSLIVKNASPLVQQVFSERIRIQSWHPYQAFGDLLRAMDRKLGHGDPEFFQKVGALSGKLDINSILKVYLSMANPERLINSCGKVWESYYRNAGQMVAISTAPDNSVVRILDFPEMHPLHCSLMAGWMMATMQSLGLKLHGGEEVKCMHLGDPYHEFRGKWR